MEKFVLCVRQKCVRQLLQPFSFASWAAGKPREAAIAHISPEDACASATSPSTSREAQDFKNTERLCPPPQLVSTICAVHPGSKKNPDLSSGQETEKIFIYAMRNCKDTRSPIFFCSFFKSIPWAEILVKSLSRHNHLCLSLILLQLPFCLQKLLK